MSRVLVVAIAVIFAGGVGWFFLSGGAAAQSSETTPIRTIRAGQTVSFTAPLPSSEVRRLCDGATWNASEQRCYFGPQNSFRATSCLAPYRRSWGNDHVSEIEVTNGGSGYSTATVTISGDGQGATAMAVLTSGAVSSINMTDHGIGYTRASVSISGDGSGATARAVVEPSPYEGVTLSGSTMRVTTNAEGPYGDLTIGYEIIGRQSLWGHHVDRGWYSILTNARCSVQNSVLVRIQVPPALSSDTWLRDEAIKGRNNRSPGDHVFPNPNQCFVAEDTYTGGTMEVDTTGSMSWCGTATNDAGQTVAPDGRICGVDVTCRRQ